MGMIPEMSTVVESKKIPRLPTCVRVAETALVQLVLLVLLVQLEPLGQLEPLVPLVALVAVTLVEWLAALREVGLTWAQRHPRHQLFGSIFPSRPRLVWCGLAGTEDDALGSHPVGCFVGSFGSSSNSGMFKVHPETLLIQSPCENGNGT